MPSREEIAELLNQVADEYKLKADLSGSAYSKVSALNLVKKYRDAAAQVSAMRCETCTYYRDASASESEWCTNEKCGTIRNQGKSFGCFAHKPKPAG